MPTTPITAEDLGAALAAFALAQVAADGGEGGNERLIRLANELHGLVDRMTTHGDAGTPAAKALGICAVMLMASETER
ncbi:hypothetical protein [Chelatococcus sp. XZ-Ab1]|uniref:hypothetical protein n=1 Tax=Chelatococcus sp. XZ-Ab1 TaxID=3034027 RepID=UPI0023E366B6|nr:hypothetical protein [Chelatococcus sp. XZ-Ab1]